MLAEPFLLCYLWVKPYIDKEMPVSSLEPLLNRGAWRQLAPGPIQNGHFVGCLLPQEEAEGDDHMVPPGPFLAKPQEAKN